jgi:hypothetical protein
MAIKWSIAAFALKPAGDVRKLAKRSSRNRKVGS